MAKKQAQDEAGVLVPAPSSVYVRHGETWALGIKPTGERSKVVVSLTSSQDAYLNILRFRDEKGLDWIDTIVHRITSGVPFTFEQIVEVGAVYFDVRVTNVSGAASEIRGLGVFTS